MKSIYVTWDEFRDVVVVPREFRKIVLVLAHEKSFGWRQGVSYGGKALLVAWDAQRHR